MATKIRMVAVPDALLKQAAERIGTLSIRDTCRVAVKQQLATVLKLARRAGLKRREFGLRKGRAVDDETWAALAEAGKEVPLGQVELLRCCLEVAAQQPDEE
jgi:hypothetical protein